MKDILFEELVYFVKERLGFDDNTILSRETKLDNDLGSYGDDSIDLILAYRDRFHVDVSNFMAGDYFRSEGFHFFSSSDKVKDLTLGDLEKGIIAGRLDEEVLNDKTFRRLH